MENKSNKKIMTDEQFDILLHQELMCSLFHVMPDDIDDETGAKLEEVILIKFLAQHPGVLKHKPLYWWIENLKNL